MQSYNNNNKFAIGLLACLFISLSACLFIIFLIFQTICTMSYLHQFTNGTLTK